MEDRKKFKEDVSPESSLGASVSSTGNYQPGGYLSSKDSNNGGVNVSESTLRMATSDASTPQETHERIADDMVSTSLIAFSDGEPSQQNIKIPEAVNYIRENTKSQLTGGEVSTSPFACGDTKASEQSNTVPWDINGLLAIEEDTDSLESHRDSRLEFTPESISPNSFEPNIRDVSRKYSWNTFDGSSVYQDDSVASTLEMDAHTPRKNESLEVRIVARPSPEFEDELYASSPPVRNGNVSHLITSGSVNSLGTPKSVESPKQAENVDQNRGHIDTAAPFESVKAAVSKFGGIVDWKAHRVQTVERRKCIEQELEKAQEEIPSYKKQAEEAEESKLQVMKELDSSKRLIEELKLDLERAQTEEGQARQDSELALLRVEEIEQGIADEASFSAKAQLEVARARHMAAVSELNSVKSEFEQLKRDYSVLESEKEAAVGKAEEAVSAAKKVEVLVEGLTVEYINIKEELESAHEAHLEAEENRVDAILAREQDTLNWELELKEAGEELEKFKQKMSSTCDLRLKLDAANALLKDLEYELGSYIESSLEQETDKEGNLSDSLNDPKTKTRNEFEAAVDSAKKELEEVKLSIEKAADEVKILKVAAMSLELELNQEKSELAIIHRREEMASIAVSSLQAELNRAKFEIALIQVQEKELLDKMVELPKQLKETAHEADQVEALKEIASEELRKAKEESEQAKARAFTMESKLHAAKKEIEAAKASEKLALAAINALQESESTQRNNNEDSSIRIALPLEEYYELNKRTHEAEEQANMQVAAAISQIEMAKESELWSLKRLEEVKYELNERKKSLEIALLKVEEAKEGKLSVERELRKRRAENEQKRKASECAPLVVDVNISPRASFQDRRTSESRTFVSSPGASTLRQRLSPRSYVTNTSDSNTYTSNANASNTNTSNTSTSNKETDSSTEVKLTAKKKKRSIFPRFFMFLGRKKAQASKLA